MPVAIITGSAGFVGSKTTRLFSEQGWAVLGVDNDMRSVYFGPGASTATNRARLESQVRGYSHLTLDIRDREAIEPLFRECGGEIGAIAHTAAQPSHGWATRDPHMRPDDPGLQPSDPHPGTLINPELPTC